MKTASFTVHASDEQSRRWKMAAEADGHRAVGSWLGAAADSYLKVRARAGLPVPIAWRRCWSTVSIQGEDVRMRGWLSPPFFAFRGTVHGHNPRSEHFSLVHQGGAVIATVKTFQQVKMLGSELVGVLIRGDPLPSPGAAVERHEREAK